MLHTGLPSVALNKGNDMLQSLKNVMLPVANAYQETERRNEESLKRMTVIMDNMSVGFNAAIVSDGMSYVEQTDLGMAQREVQRLVADNIVELQAANIAVITKNIKEEYQVVKIEDLVEES